MTFGSPPPRPSPARPRRRGALAPTLVVLGVLVVAVLILAQVWTEVLWYQQLGFGNVIRTEWGTRAILFVLGFLVMGGAVYWSLNFGYRSRPVYAPSTQEQANLDQYREAIEPLRRLVMIVGPAVLGLFAGAAASQQWQTIQLWMHGGSVGKTDPQYGIDLGFYLFTLPGLRFVVSFLMAVVVLVRHRRPGHPVPLRRPAHRRPARWRAADDAGGARPAVGHRGACSCCSSPRATGWTGSRS